MRIDQIAINSVSTSGDSLEERLDAYAGAGFQNIEFQLGHVKSFLAGGKSPRDARAALDERGLTCTGGFETHLAVFAPSVERARNHATILENATLLQQLGGNCLVVGTDGPPIPVEDPVGEIAAVFRDIASEMARYDVNLAIEFNWSPVVKSLRTAVEVARRSGEPNAGVLFDTAHYHCTPTKFDQINSEAVRTIKNVHVNDMRDKPGELSNCNADRELPGEGHLDLRSIFARIASFGYTGHYVIEMFSDRLWAMPAAESARLMYESMVRLC
jgi:4-hydroxyphenylpyruvate dioxygenase